MAITSKITAKKYCVDIEDTIDGELPAKSQIRTDDGASNILNEDSLNNFNGNYGFDNKIVDYLAKPLIYRHICKLAGCIYYQFTTTD